MNANGHIAELPLEEEGQSSSKQMDFLDSSLDSSMQQRCLAAGMTSVDQAQAKFDQGPVSPNTATPTQLGLFQSDVKGQPTSQSSDLGSFRDDLQSGRLNIPPFKEAGDTDFSAEGRLTYQFPPALLDLDPDAVSAHRRRFDRSALVPSNESSDESQIMEYAQIWAKWIVEVPDETRRNKLLDHIFGMATKAWCKAIEMGYRPEVSTPRRATPKTPAQRLKPRAEVLPLGLRGRPRKHDENPSSVPILVASHNFGLAWAVTAGELEEAGVSETRLRRRAADQDSLDEAGEELLEEILDDCDGQIAETNWFDTEDKTVLNPMGRDLQVYCLYEVLKARTSIAQLQGFYEKHKTAKQKENTQKRIDAEQERENLFMALALEMQDDDPRPPTPPLSSPSSSHGQALSGIIVVETVQTDELDLLIDAVETMVEEKDLVLTAAKLELLEMSEDETMIGVSIDELESNIHRCKLVLREIMSFAQQWRTLSVESDTADDVATRIQDLELKVQSRKELLRGLLPLLLEERESAKADVDRENEATDEAMDATVSTNMPSDNAMTPPPEMEPVTPAKRLAEDDLFGAEALASKKPKVENKRRLSQIEILVPSIKEVRGRLDQKDAKSYNHVDTKALSTEPTSSASTPHPGSRVAILGVRHGFDLTQFLSQKVFHLRGFSYRYAPESTQAQRRSMVDIVNAYVDNCNRPDDLVDKAWRFGKYQTLAHHTDPERTTIVHGIWDLEDGSRPSGFQRFYNGEASYVAELEHTLMSDTEGEEDEPVRPLPPKKKVNTSPNRKDSAIIPKQQSFHSTTIGKPDKPSSVGGGKTIDVTGRNSSSIRNHGTISKQKSKATNLRLTMKQSTSAARLPPSSFGGSISASRPRRQTAKINYADESTIDDDDEFLPAEDSE